MRGAILERLLAAKEAKRPTALVTDLESGAQALLVGDAAPEGDLALSPSLRSAAAAAIAADRSGLLDPALAGNRRLFAQVHSPALRLIIVGAVHLSQPLAPMAALAGYAVTVIDPRGAFATALRFPGVTLDPRWPDEAMSELKPDARTAVVTLTHDPKLDDPALKVALPSPAFYVGSLGSKRTHAQRIERLTADGMAPDALRRLHAPVGLAIGAKSPAEIAVSILAEITQVRHAGARAPAVAA